MKIAFISQGPIFEAPASPFRLISGYSNADPQISQQTAFTHIPLSAFPFGKATQRMCLRAAEQIAAGGYDLLALSLYCWNSPNLLSVARYAKQMNPGLTIVAGGPGAYDEGPALLAQYPELDFAIDRDGELPFRLLLRYLLLGSATSAGVRSGSETSDRKKPPTEHFTPILTHNHDLNSVARVDSLDTSSSRVKEHAERSISSDALLERITLEQVPWLTYRVNGIPVKSHDRTIINDLDEIPSPVIGGSREELLTRFYEEDFSAIVLETSRGCPVNCKFCQYPKGGSGSWRYFSLERVLSELNYLKDVDLNEVYFADGIFTLDKERAAAILDFFIVEMPHASLQVEIKLDILPELLVDRCRSLLAQGRLRFGVGIQSVNKVTLDTIGRPTNLARLRENVNKLSTNSRRPMRWDLIYGLPGDSMSDLLAGFDFVAANAPDATLAIQPLHVLPGTELRTRAIELGLVYDALAPYNILKTKTLSSQDVIVADILASLLDMYTPALLLAFRKDRLALKIDNPYRRVFDASYLSAVADEGHLSLPVQLEFIKRILALAAEDNLGLVKSEFLRDCCEYLFIVKNAGGRTWRESATELLSYRADAASAPVRIGIDTSVRHGTLLGSIDKFFFQFNVAPWIEESTSSADGAEWPPIPDPQWCLVSGSQVQLLTAETYELLGQLANPITVRGAIDQLLAKDQRWSDLTPDEIAYAVKSLADGGLVTACSE